MSGSAPEKSCKSASLYVICRTKTRIDTGYPQTRGQKAWATPFCPTFQVRRVLDMSCNRLVPRFSVPERSGKHPFVRLFRYARATDEACRGRFDFSGTPAASAFNHNATAINPCAFDKARALHFQTCLLDHLSPLALTAASRATHQVESL